MGVVVQKYGGSSLSSVERIQKVADRVSGTRASGKSVVVVVSAMGNTTDSLLELARSVSPSPTRRELDMLLSAGERISMALLSIALNDRGISAVSFTGSQSGIITDTAHTNARILEVRPARVEEELSKGRVVIVAGYQGVSKDREVTTLGRGGSDTTAVALASALQAEGCEIYSDVEGVFTADPRVVPEARSLPEISYEEMQELAEAGAQVLNAQAVEFAKAAAIQIRARSAHGGDRETVVRSAPLHARVVGVTSQKELLLLELSEAGTSHLQALFEVLESRGVSWRQLLYAKGARYASLVLPLENLHDIPSLEEELKGRLRELLAIRHGIGAVSVIGAGITDRTANLRLVADGLGDVLGLSTSSFRISALLEATRIDEAVRSLHRAFIESDPTLAPRTRV